MTTPETENLVPPAWTCPVCEEDRMDYLANDEGRITCETCGCEYEID